MPPCLAVSARSSCAEHRACYTKGTATDDGIGSGTNGAAPVRAVSGCVLRTCRPVFVR